MRNARVMAILLVGITLITGFACGGGTGSKPTPTPTSTSSEPQEEVWTTYSNLNTVNDLAIEGNNIWIATSAGVACLDIDNETYIRYTTAEGLTHNQVNAVAIDDEGNKWFGSGMQDSMGGGISVFDGSSWATYNTSDGLSDNFVRDIVIDKYGNKWFATDHGCNMFNGKNWTTYESTGQCKQWFDGTIAKDGSVWCGVGTQLATFNSVNWVFEDIAGSGEDIFNVIRAVAIIDEDDKWTSNNRGLYHWNGSAWTLYDTSNALPANDVVCIAIDDEGNVWAGTQSDGVCVYDGTSWTTYTTEDGLGSNAVNAIRTDEEGNVWFGTYFGVSKFDGTNWTTYIMPDGPASNYVRDIAIDSIGNKWFSAVVVSKFDGQSWTHYTTHQGLVENDVLTLAVDDQDNVWVGTWEGVSRFDGDTWTTYTTNEGLTSNETWEIAKDNDGNMWFGTESGVTWFDGKDFKTSDELPRDWITAIAVDHENNKWFSLYNIGVCKFDGKNCTTYSSQDTSLSGLLENEGSALAVDSDGNIWFGTQYGAYKFDGTSWHPYFEACYINSSEGYIGPFEILAIAGDKEGNMWFGTNGGGVIKYDGTNWTSYITEDGLADNRVHAIAIDDEGNKWFGTEGGISKFGKVSLSETQVAKPLNVRYGP